MAIPVHLNSGFVPASLSILSSDEHQQKGYQDTHKKETTDELTIILKELRAAIFDEAPPSILGAYKSLLSTLHNNLGIFSADEAIHYIKSSVDLLGDQMLKSEFQKIFICYLLDFTKVYTKIVMKPVKDGLPQAVLDLYFLNKMKEIYTPYFLGEHYHEWKEICISNMVEMGKSFCCTTYELAELVSNFTMVDVLFSNDPMEMTEFRNKLLEKSKENSFEFLKRLFGFEISSFLFSETMKEVVYGEMSEEQINIIGRYVEWSRIPLGKTLELVHSIEGRCQISSEGWNYLLGCLFRKINKSKTLFFLDIWKMMRFYFLISKKFELDKDVISQFYNVFENKIRLILVDKISLSQLRYGVEEQRKLIEDLIEGLLLLYHFKTDRQKKMLVNILLGIAYMHMSVLKVEHSYKFLEKIAPNIHSCNETDNILFMFVMDLISQCKGENPQGQMMLILNLGCLSLFKNSNLTFLLRNWNYLHKNSQELAQGDYFLVEALSYVFGISEREIVLHLYVQPQEMKNLQSIINKLKTKVNLRVEPTSRELILIKKYCVDADIPVGVRIDFFYYLLCFYTLPLEFEELILKKILMSFVRTKNSEKLAITGKFDALKTNDIEGNFYKATLQLLSNGYFVMDKKYFGEKYTKLLTYFLLHPFKLDAAIQYKEFHLWANRILDSYGIRNNYLESCIYLNWMNACKNFYRTIRKGAYDIKESNKEKYEERLVALLTVKQTLHQLFIEAFIDLSEINPKAEILVGPYLRALNRPLLTEIVAGESLLVIDKK